MSNQLFDMSDEPARTATPVPAADAPLAVRMRPGTIDELVGQQHVLGTAEEPTTLRRAISDGRPHSMVLYGPPGTGKTTLARIVARSANAAFEELSAVQAGRAEVRGVIDRAAHRRKTSGEPTIFFLDEIHRFNKSQQDALLPAVEEGLLTLVGATTENPYFEVNAALLSRCQLYTLEALSPDEVVTILRRGAAEIAVEAADELLALVAARAGGDARTALGILELAGETARAERSPLTAAHIDDAAHKRPIVHDRDAHYDVTSAFIKSMRGSDPDAAVYYLAVMLEAGEDPRFIARRMVILASEDVGNADPRALQVAVAAAHALEHVGLPEAQLNLAQAAIYLAQAPKSNAVTRAIMAARRDARERGSLRPPAALRDAHYAGAKTFGHGVGYVYPHDDPRGFEFDHLPEELQGTRYYEPRRESGEERPRPRE